MMMSKRQTRDVEIHRLIGGALCLDFTNTLNGHRSQEGHEYLHDYTDLVLWSRHAGILTPAESAVLLSKAEQLPAQAQIVYQETLALREMLFRIFSTLASGLPLPTGDVEALNVARAEALRHSRLVQAGEGFVLGWEAPDALERMRWPIILSAVEVLTSESTRRLRECNGNHCDWLFIDSSRNHMRRWCSMDECGNRAKMKRRYARQREDA
jgi:predicted RNA-binding Zn ribbon-like protein